MSSFPRRHGFSLIELLVVIAIIAILVGLLMAGVQKARETANRVACMNNLRQLGLALHNFENTLGGLPPSEIYAPVAELGISNPSPSCGWVPCLLPYIEQNAISSEFDLNLPYYDPANHAASLMQLRLLQCPSSIQQNRTDNYVDDSHPIQPWGACSDYGALAGYAHGPVVSWALETAGYTDKYGWMQALAAMDYNRLTPFEEITDGLSNTIVVGECSMRTVGWRKGTGDAGTYISGGAWAGPNNTITATGSLYDGNWNANATGPCTMNCTNIYNIFSFHETGSNFLLADGSVQKIRESIGWAVLARLMTKNSGEAAAVFD